jgi:hypothetical protein
MQAEMYRMTGKFDRTRHPVPDHFSEIRRQVIFPKDLTPDNLLSMTPDFRTLTPRGRKCNRRLRAIPIRRKPGVKSLLPYEGEPVVTALPGWSTRL